ncbi:uncharacterized protein CTHT_0067900 [Thermochaetoides thermophila DSM 1495]|uniref:Malate dehydrogenase-like protein n=1 Tax=Chaetomium thermophilum (strain DSM 1495 / CBS 144.50 / IMI 039719) TaxID=759272 RepID=G0SGX4_CHATD|nr:hypothetical protein CTHT_0067900 [Thermochaetoides thermophila DSM 1495]EGS17463.1 hypothetical protein CTHT_0067900 [Thermochaetoides thermophila DSM 1495]
MRFSLVASTLATCAWAAPPFPRINVLDTIPNNIRAISDYFNLLATKVQESKKLAAPPACDLSQVSLPEYARSSLPPPSPGLVLKHIAIGRGTQNYTCDPGAEKPRQTGAVATLFNASCTVATSPELASLLGHAALQFPLHQSLETQRLAPSNLAVSGVHFFTKDGAPWFDLDVSPLWKMGGIVGAKNTSAQAPETAAKGLGGEPAVPWLKLVAKESTGGLQEVYRIETVGGSAPQTCSGMPIGREFQVEYATQYWFYAKP